MKKQVQDNLLEILFSISLAWVSIGVYLIAGVGVAMITGGSVLLLVSIVLIFVEAMGSRSGGE